MAAPDQKTLKLTVHGRIIDHLGIQMYQSPVAAVAELVANAWDADAENVRISLPKELDDAAEFVVKDDGLGMTLEQCEERYLKVGWCRRAADPDERSPEKGRGILGRKGIGKFAGFGIAHVIHVETISKETGEKTVFQLDVDELRSDDYIESGWKEIPVVEYLPPDRKQRRRHGTTVTLRGLRLARRPSSERFAKSMARRFLLHQRVDDFRVLVDDSELPTAQESESVQFVFPRDYREEEKPEGLSVEGEWGIENLASGREVRWRIVFYKQPIDDEELRGVTVLSRGKLAQRPFFFNISGGVGGQHGQAYITGQVQADYIDILRDDLIAPERQRISWEHDEALPLESWGQARVKQLLGIWRDRRSEDRRRQIDDKVAGFSKRLAGC